MILPTYGIMMFIDELADAKFHRKALLTLNKKNTFYTSFDTFSDLIQIEVERSIRSVFSFEIGLKMLSVF